MRFDDKVAVVTGAAMGLGAAVARRFAQEGAAVALLDRDRDAAARTADEIDATGGRALAVACDVSSPGDVRAAVDAVVEAFGPIDVLVNCAAVSRYATVPEMTEEDWDLQIATNLTGTFLTCKYVIPHMRTPGAAIVNTASVQAIASQRNVAAYTASKGGVISMTKTMALDHAEAGIRVNAVCPGSVETPMLRAAAEMERPDDPRSVMEGWGRQHPLGFLAQPEDVAAVIAFLASDEAKLITGAPILVDQGLIAKQALS